MWKEFLQKVIESCVCMDPMAYMYYVAAAREQSQLVLTAQDEADERELIRLVARLESSAQRPQRTGNVIQLPSSERHATSAK